jgi:hypothetical protein
VLAGLWGRVCLHQHGGESARHSQEADPSVGRAMQRAHMDPCRSGALYGGEYALALGCTLATGHSEGEGESTFQWLVLELCGCGDLPDTDPRCAEALSTWVV